MAELYVTAKATGTLETISSNNQAVRSPDRFSFSFAAEKRIENQIIGIDPSGTATIDISTEGMTSTSMLKLEVVTVGKSANLKFNGDTNGIDLIPTSTTDRAVFLASVDFATLEITNLDAANVINVAVSIFEKRIP